MPNKKGFTLMEIIVVLIIIGGLAAAVLPNFILYINQAKATNVENNLLTIYHAEYNYYYGHGDFCNAQVHGAGGTGSTSNWISYSGGCAGSLALINTNLSLNIPDDGSYTYSCDPPPPPTTNGFNCSASSTASDRGGAPLVLMTVQNGPIIPLSAVKGGTGGPWFPNPRCMAAWDQPNGCPLDLPTDGYT